VEQNRGAVKVIEENLKKTGLRNGKVVCREVGSFLKTEKREYDLIFADPPYADGLTDAARDLAALEGWAQWLSEDGYLVLEKEAMGDLPEPGGLKLLQQRDYGRSRLVIYQRAS
jgi:16S rRNA (guanine966-N2)-methyltransferase